MVTFNDGVVVVADAATTPAVAGADDETTILMSAKLCFYNIFF